MRKPIFITALLAITTLFAGAQTVDDALKQLGKSNDKAKEAIDKLTADPNSKNAEAWYAKAQIYNALAIDDKFKASVPDAYEQAFEAFKKAYDIDPNNKRMLLDLYKTGFVAYEGVANKAAAAYQANNMAVAFEGYKKTLEDGDYLKSKNLSYSGFSVPKLDTGMVFMAGYTAMKIDKADEATTYFTRIAEAKIGKEPDYIIPYQFLAFQYKSKKDEANFKKFVDLGRQVFPKDPYFITIRLDWARDNNNFPELFNAYEELIALQPDSLNNYLSYGSEMFDYLFIKNPDKKPADYDAVAAKIETQIKKTMSKDYDPLSSNLILGQLYYNEGLDHVTEADKIKSTKPEDTRKKTDLKAKAVTRYDLAIPYTEKVASLLEQKGMATLNAKEKHTLKNMYIMLGDMYTLKGDKVKSAEYDKKYSSLK
jgi:tetratricopeptide (TPR) repeat protein